MIYFRKLSPLLTNIVLGIGLFLIVLIGGLYISTDFSASLIWPASGVAAAIYYIYNKKIWHTIIISVFLANFIIRYFFLDFSLLSAIALSLVFALVSLLEAFIFYFTIKVYEKDTVINLRSTLYFIFAAFLAAFVASLINNIALLIYTGDLDYFFTNFIIWFLGNFFGILIFGSTYLVSFFLDPVISKSQFAKEIIFYLIFIVFSFLYLSDFTEIINGETHSYLFALFFMLIAPFFSFRLVFIFSITFLIMFFGFSKIPDAITIDNMFRVLLEIDIFLLTMTSITLIVKVFYLKLEKLNKSYIDQNNKMNSLIDSTSDLLTLSDELLTTNKDLQEKYIIRMFNIALKMFNKVDYGICYMSKGTVEVLDSVGHDKAYLNNLSLESTSFYSDLEKPFLQKNAEREIELSLGKKYEKYKLLNPEIKESIYFSVFIAEDKVGGFSLDIRKSSKEFFNKNDIAQIAAFQSLMNSFYKMQFLNSKNKDLKNDIVLALIRALDLFDKYTKGHSEDVAFLSRALGKRLNLSHDEVYDLYWAGIVHDVGKVGVDSYVINSLVKLTEDEYRQIKMHPVYGYSILHSIEDLKPLAKIVRHHHEWYNGEGYPDGLKGEGIPFLSRVICIADAVSSMATDRTYRPRLPVDKIIAELNKFKGIQFDPGITEEMIKYIQDGYLKDHYLN